MANRKDADYGRYAYQPTNVYGQTKLMIEMMLAQFSRAYGLHYVALRYFNAAGADGSGAIGEDHTPETHLIPLILQTALGQRDSIKIFGTDYPTPDGTCVRDYIHVTDLADATFASFATCRKAASRSTLTWALRTASASGK